MKQLLILLVILQILTSCNQKKTAQHQSKFKPSSTPERVSKPEPKKIDTTVVYWQTNFDTIRENQEINIGNEKHHLRLITYSLNDSSIVSINGNYKGIYHDYSTEIILTNIKDTILNKKITKKAFKDSLNTEFYKLAVLTRVEYVGVRSNRLLFKGEFNVPDTDWVIENEFAIYFKTAKKNNIDSWNYKDLDF